MTDAPTLTGQDIGEAAAATRRVLDRLLAANHVTFPGWLVLNSLAIDGPTLERHDLDARLALAPGAPSVADALGDLTAAGLVVTSADDAGRPPAGADDVGGRGQGAGQPPPGGVPAGAVTLTAAGAERTASVRRGIQQASQRLYGSLPAEDLATTHRILAAVTARANADVGL